MVVDSCRYIGIYPASQLLNCLVYSVNYELIMVELATI